MGRCLSDPPDSLAISRIVVARLIPWHVSPRGAGETQGKRSNASSAWSQSRWTHPRTTRRRNAGMGSEFLGTKWDDVVPVIPPASLHLMVIGPLSVALLGYLWAVGEASAVLRATLVGLPLMAAVMLPLLPVIGAPAVGFGWLASAVGEATVLIRSARKHCDFRIAPGLVTPTVCATVGSTLGWIVAEHGRRAGLAEVCSRSASTRSCLPAFHRKQLVDTVYLATRGCTALPRARRRAKLMQLDHTRRGQERRFSPSRSRHSIAPSGSLDACVLRSRRHTTRSRCWSPTTDQTTGRPKCSRGSPTRA